MEFDHSQRRQQSRLSFAQYTSRLSETAVYLKQTTPSGLNEKRIIEMESLLNGLYLQAVEEQWVEELREAILVALGTAGELSYIIQQNKLRNAEFFITIKRFGDLLAILATY